VHMPVNQADNADTKGRPRFDIGLLAVGTH
jgi:hypothetical protein